MNELLALYTEIVRAATDEQIPQHLANLLTDAKAVEEAIQNVITQAKQRTVAQ